MIYLYCQTCGKSAARHAHAGPGETILITTGPLAEAGPKRDGCHRPIAAGAPACLIERARCSPEFLCSVSNPLIVMAQATQKTRHAPEPRPWL